MGGFGKDWKPSQICEHVDNNKAYYEQVRFLIICITQGMVCNGWVSIENHSNNKKYFNQVSFISAGDGWQWMGNHK